MIKKLLISFLVSLVIITSIAPNFLIARAQTQTGASGSAGSANKAGSTAPNAAPTGTWYNQSFGDWFSKVYDENVSPGSEIFGERYTAAQVQWVIYGLMAFIINAPFGDSPIAKQTISCLLTTSTDLQSCLDTLSTLLSSGIPNQQFAISDAGKSENLFGRIFADRSLSGVTYIKQRLQNFSIIPVANAAPAPGFGFGALEPVQSMWTASRDVAFGLFVIVAIVFAFMIMFRVKVSPQLVISVQSALPKLFIALILVTFSYAIAGFLIDLMYVFIGILSIVFIPFFKFLGGAPKAIDIFDFLTLGKTFLGLKLGIFGIVVTYIPVFVIGLLLVIIANIGAIGVAAGGLSVALFTFLSGGVLLLIGLIIVIVAIIILVWHSIRIMWMFIKTFANILLLTIFAPLYITAGTVVPTLGFGTWLKSFISNLLTFVTGSAMILLMYGFLVQGIVIAMDSVAGAGKSPGEFLVKFIVGSTTIDKSIGLTSEYWPPLLGSKVGSSAGVGLLFLGVSFVLFTLIPKASDIIASFVSGKPFAYGTAVGEAVNPLGIAGYAGAFGVGKVESKILQKTGTETPEGRAVSTISQMIQKRMSGRP